jgi:hypothetical protein
MFKLELFHQLHGPGAAANEKAGEGHKKNSE